MERITQKDLENLVLRINKATRNTESQYTKQADGQFKGNIGNYSLDYAYGGVKLVQMVNEHGGIREISHSGFGTKRELHVWMCAFLDGLSIKTN
ncbi:MAG: hypothetical protein IMZ53_14970 [Thermoplasmata archaeon]|nr:hypothetical protein [Thermoplasmata archaeon]